MNHAEGNETRVLRQHWDRPRLDLGAAALITLLGALLRFYELGHKSLWLDEIINAGSSVAENVMGWGQEPLHIVATHLSMALFGTRSEFVVRLPSALAGILCVPAIYRLGKACFSPVEGLVAAFLLAISPLHLSHSQEARHYAFLTLFSIISVVYYDEMVRGSSRRAWIGFASATALNLLTHKFALFLLLVEVLAAPVLELRHQSEGRGATKPRLNRGLARELGLALALIALLYAPSVVVTWTRLGERDFFQSTGSLPLRTSLSVSFLAQLLASLGAGSGVALSLYLGALLLGLALCVVEHRRIATLFLLGLALPLLLYSLWRPDLVFYVRYMIFLLPLYLLLIARGIAAGSAGTARLACSRMVPSLSSAEGIVSTGLTLFAVTAFGLVSIGPLAEWYETPREDWRGVASYLRDHVEQGDVILCDGVHYGHGGDSNRTQRGLRYYLESLYSGDLILRETEIARGMEGIGDDSGQVWAVVFRGSMALSSGGRDAVEVTDFQEVSVVRAVHAGKTLRENSITVVEALIRLMPRPEAIADLDSALVEMRRQEVESYLRAGNTHMEQGDIGAAKSDYRRALEIDPNRAGVHVRLADAHRAEGQFQEAIEEYGRAVELNPDLDGEAWFHMRLAHVFRETGQFDQAVIEYELVLDLDPDHEAAAKWLDELLKP